MEKISNTVILEGLMPVLGWVVFGIIMKDGICK